MSKKTIPDTLADKVDGLPVTPGVYIFKDVSGREIYVGKAKSIRKRVRSYFTRAASANAKTESLVLHIADLNFIQCESEVDALITEARLIRELRPKYNMELKDNTSFPYVRITWSEEYPRILVTRDIDHPDDEYIGPFTDVSALRSSLKILNRVFPIRLCRKKITNDPKNRFNRACINHNIGLCCAPCTGRISRHDYRQLVLGFIRCLKGKKSQIIRELKNRMKTLSESERFEEAAVIRDRISALNNLNKITPLASSAGKKLLSPDVADGVTKLQKQFHLTKPPRHIEGIDCANLSGKESVASVVTFFDGVPEKRGYRRYRIKTVDGPDDLSMIREVVLRRYSRLEREQKKFPEIVLIDGGLTHLKAADEAFPGFAQHSVLLLSLAKENEIIFSKKHAGGVRLSRTSPALKLLQYVRDEAHRFAQHYHHILRDKYFSGRRKNRK